MDAGDIPTQSPLQTPCSQSPAQALCCMENIIFNLHIVFSSHFLKSGGFQLREFSSKSLFLVAYGLKLVTILTLCFWQGQCVKPLNEHSLLDFSHLFGQGRGRGSPSTCQHLSCCPAGVANPGAAVPWGVRLLAWVLLSLSFPSPASPGLESPNSAGAALPGCQQGRLFPP